MQIKLLPFDLKTPHQVHVELFFDGWLTIKYQLSSTQDLIIPGKSNSSQFKDKLYFQTCFWYKG